MAHERETDGGKTMSTLDPNDTAPLLDSTFQLDFHVKS